MPKPYVGQLPKVLAAAKCLPKVLAAAKCLPKVLAPKHPALQPRLRRVGNEIALSAAGL